MRQRHNFVWLAALAILILVAWTVRGDIDESTSVVVLPHLNAHLTEPRRLAVIDDKELSSKSADSNPREARPLDRDPIAEASIDPFKVVSFAPKPVKTVAVTLPPSPPPPKPVAPSFPYKYFGRIVDIDGHVQTYLSSGDTLVAVHEQDVLGQVYRIDTIGRTQIDVTYLPLGEKMMLATPSASH